LWERGLNAAGQGDGTDTTLTALLCTLRPGETDQMELQYMFNENVTFTIKGPGPVYISGNLTDGAM
jgi:hypothetical protein